MLTRCNILLFVIVLCITSCRIVPKFPKIVAVDSLLIEKNSDFLLKARINADIYNPNSFSFRIDQMKYIAYVGYLQLGGGEIMGPIWFYKEDTNTLHQQPFYILYNNLQDILDRREQLDSVPVTFFIKARMNISPILPVFYVKTIWLKPAEFIRSAINSHNIENLISIKNIEITDLGVFKSKLKGNIVLKNDFPLSYRIDSLCLKIYDKYDQPVGQIRICDKEVKEFSHQQLPFEIYLDNILAAVGIMGQYIEEEFRYYAIGNLYLTIRGQKFIIPIHQSIGLEIERID